MSLRLLHLSDIHFKTYDGNEYRDLDTDIRSEIELDLRNLRKIYGNIDLTLIGGDIAFSGKKDEYDKADLWIKKICKITGCREEFVFTVPGNHDIERPKITHIVKKIQQSLKECGSDRAAINNLIEELLRSPDISYLLTPLENYNNFALRFGSIPLKGNMLFWEKHFELDGLKLRIRGVNSAIASNSGDDETTAKLVLGEHQCVMHRDPGVINVVLCHHPPSWLCDGKQAEQEFKNRARIHLFGHKHVFEAKVVKDQCLVLAAGAMHPERAETGWKPTFNVIDLSIEREPNSATLVVKLYRRIWDEENQKFGPQSADGQNDSETYRIQLEDHETEKEDLEFSTGKPASTDTLMAESTIYINDHNHIRRLAYLFLALPYHIRLSIAAALDLLQENDERLRNTERAQQYFKRAIDQNKLKEMWDLVMEHQIEKELNPFNK